MEKPHPSAQSQVFPFVTFVIRQSPRPGRPRHIAI